MILVIDIGNTNIKTAVYEDVNLIEKFVFNKTEAKKKFEIILNKFHKIEKIILSSVGNLEKSTFEYLKNQKEIIEISHTFSFPFKNSYGTPKTLGVDRMVLASGASLLHPNKNILIIDAGTCVTYDYISSNNEYFGGAISPGLRLRYESLHNYTAKLPLLTKKEPDNLIGNNTQESIHSGIVNGLTLEIDGFISEYFVKNNDLTIILTGGDTNFLSNRLKSIIFADENFLLKSLHQLYIYSLKND